MTGRGILAVCWGPQEGVKAILQPDRTLTVGRGESAGLRLPHDEALAPLHFELRWEGPRPVLQHRAGLALTLLGGQAVDAAELTHGAWLRAGGTDFTFHFEAHTPPAAPRAPAARARAERALADLRARGPLFALLDLARDPRIGELLRESVDPCRSLFEGTLGAQVAEVAPHLVALAPDSRLLGDLVREGWGLRWGAWLVSDRPLAEVRRHLRKFTLVQLEGQSDPVYFRFQDPDVLRVYLQSCAPDERAQWFGDIVREFFAEDPSAPDGAWSLRR